MKIEIILLNEKGRVVFIVDGERKGFWATLYWLVKLKITGWKPEEK